MFNFGAGSIIFEMSKMYMEVVIRRLVMKIGPYLRLMDSITS